MRDEGTQGRQKQQLLGAVDSVLTSCGCACWFDSLFECFSFALFIKCFCHEIDHLHGQMYVDKAIGGIRDVNYEEFDEMEE